MSDANTRRASLRSRTALPNDASDEEKFARDWLLRHPPIGAERVKEHAALAKKGGCPKINNNQLSHLLHEAWKTEQKRLETLRIDAERAQAAAVEKAEAREKRLKAQREASRAVSEELLEKFGVVLVKEKTKGIEHLETDIDPSIAEDTEASPETVQEMADDVANGDVETLKVIKANLGEEYGFKLIPYSTAKSMHGLGAKPKKPLAQVAVAIRTSKKNKKGEESEEEEEEEGEEEEEEEERKQERKAPVKAGRPASKKQKTKATAASNSGANSAEEEFKERVEALYTAAMLKIKEARAANPMEAPKSLKALRDACELEAKKPLRAEGFGGSALDSSVPYYNRFFNHITWK